MDLTCRFFIHVQIKPLIKKVIKKCTTLVTGFVACISPSEHVFVQIVNITIESWNKCEKKYPFDYV